MTMIWYLVNLAGALATHGLDSRSDLGRGFHCPLTNKGESKTYHFIEFVNLREDWQFFTGLENFMILS